MGARGIWMGTKELVFDMWPANMAYNSANLCLVNAELSREVNLSHSVSIEAPDFSHVISRDFGSSVFHASNIKKAIFSRMSNIGPVRYILKVIDVVVCLISVLMVDTILIGKRADFGFWLRQKCFRNKRMNMTPCAMATETKRNSRIAAIVGERLENASLHMQGLAVFAHHDVIDRSDSPVGGNFVYMFKILDRSPFFRHEISNLQLLITRLNLLYHNAYA